MAQSPSPRRRALALLAATATAAALTGAVSGAAQASSPPTQAVTAPSPGSPPATVSWTGTSPAGANPTSDCNNTAATSDSHQITLTVPTGLYPGNSVDATFSITFSDPNAVNDLILTVNGPDGKEIGSADTANTTEVLSVPNPKSGTYTVLTCGYSSTSQPYTGKLVVTTKPPTASLPSAPAQGLAFSASVPADPQRDESEPLIISDKSGRFYTCGPTGFSNASDYAQVSTDNGKQFHLLGQPPRGQQGSGGGGDCAIATGQQKNANGAYTYSYAGLGPLTGFTTSTSPDYGHTITTAGPQGNGTNGSSVGADRQWETFLDANTVLLNYNGQQPRQVVVQKSTDGGLTFDTGTVASAPNPDFPGPMKTLPAQFNPAGAAKGPVGYFSYTSSDSTYSYVNLALTTDGNATWRNCLAVKVPLADSGGLQAFSVTDNDNAGNLYLAYSDKKNFHTYLTTLPVSKLAACNQDTSKQPTVNPGWSTPVQVDRDQVRTTVFPWLAAGGAPGRVAVAFYGSETAGDPNNTAFTGSWFPYVNQSLNALSPGVTFSQVKATTHPNHFGQICLGGLGCTTGGDRTLGDFFALSYNPVHGTLAVVFNRTNKKPGDAAGYVSSPTVVTQIAGPSNGGGTVSASQPVLRASSSDPANDALVNYSGLLNTPPVTNEPALDILSQAVSPQVDPATNAAVSNGGFTVTLKVADLSSAALQQAMTDTNSQQLLWVFDFVNGYQNVAASAYYDPVNGFTFGYNDYTTDAGGCGNGKCVIFPGGTALKGKADQKAGTLTFSVPRSLLRGLSGSTAAGQTPKEVPATAGTRFYDATAFSFGNPAGQSTQQSWLYPADNAPAMDFVLPTTSTFSFRRLAGADRYATAAEVATRSHATADTVILASGNTGHYPDALAGSYLAGSLGAPVLLTDLTTLPAATRQALVTLGATKVVIVGGPAAVSTAVENQLKADKYAVTRVAGADRYATAKAVAEQPGATYVGLDEAGKKTAVLASGQNFPDALVSGPLAYHSRFPVLTTDPGSLSPSAAAALKDLGIQHVLIAGGPQAVSAAVESSLRGLNLAVDRFAGTDRTQTATLIAAYELTKLGYDPSHVDLATGADFADALSGGPYAGLLTSPMLLTAGSSLGTATQQYLSAHAAALRTGDILGGAAAVPLAVQQQAETQARG